MIEHGDARELAAQLEDESVGLIFTDPPYGREWLPLYEWLGKEAARLLKPGGFLAVMSGGAHLDKIMGYLCSHLTYYWQYHLYMNGSTAGLVWPLGNRQAPIVTRVKPITVCVKGKGAANTRSYTPFDGSAIDKRFHHWQQDEQSARYFIELFSQPGDLVLDPFAGSGTTGRVALWAGREFAGYEIDRDVALEANARLDSSLFAIETLPLFAAQPQPGEE